jgi:hypothetical protein
MYFSSCVKYIQDLEMDEPFTDDAELKDKPDQAESQDDEFIVKDAFFLGGAMGFAYEEGLRERKRRKRKRFRDDSD